MEGDYMKKTSRNTGLGISLGMCFGVSLGCCLGLTVFDNIGVGMCLGLCIGMGAGTAIGSAKDAAINKQLEEKGYTVKSVVNKPNSEDYTVTIAAKDGVEQEISVIKHVMDAQKFKDGDFVYLSKDGALEQAYSDDDTEK